MKIADVVASLLLSGRTAAIFIAGVRVRGNHRSHATLGANFTFPFALAEIRLRNSTICAWLKAVLGRNDILPSNVTNKKMRLDS